MGDRQRRPREPVGRLTLHTERERKAAALLRRPQARTNSSVSGTRDEEMWLPRHRDLLRQQGRQRGCPGSVADPRACG